MADKVLEGVRVADWTIAHAGPKGAVWLAALGAEVIHIEQAVLGDHARQAGTGNRRTVQDIPSRVGDGLSATFEIANFNKKSITVDLKTEQGKEIIYRLVAKSDVFTTNQLPDTIEKLGMDYDMLLKYNPKLIYCTNNIMGYNGPYRLNPGFENHGYAISGLMTTSGERGQIPVTSTWGLGDCTSGFVMFCGVVTALLYRERSGEGQRVDTSQMQTLMNVPVSEILSVYSLLNEEQRRANPYGGVCRAEPREGGLAAEANCYRCKDGKWVQLGVVGDKEFKGLVEAIGCGEIARDERFREEGGRREHNQELMDILSGVFKGKAAKEWREELAGSGVAFYPVDTIPDFLEDPQAVENGMIIDFEHPQLGKLKLPGMPFNLSETPWGMERAAPEMGQHTEEVLLDLGYSWEEILKFREQKIV